MKNVVTISKSNENYTYSTQIVFDDFDKSIRLDVDNGVQYDHIKINRKQAVKILKLLEEFILYNP